jgi:hypothetical protein
MRWERVTVSDQSVDPRKLRRGDLQCGRYARVRNTHRSRVLHDRGKLASGGVVTESSDGWVTERHHAIWFPGEAQFLTMRLTQRSDRRQRAAL